MNLKTFRKRDLRSDGRALGRTLAKVAAEYRDGAAPALRREILIEFLAMCHSAFGLIAVENTRAEEILDAAEEEFLEINPDHRALVLTRMNSYLEAAGAIEKGDSSPVGRVFATSIGGNADDGAWAAGAFTEACALFLDLATR